MKTQRVGRFALRYLHQGQGPPLVFLQGFGIRPSFYAPLIDRLARRFEVIAPDLLRPNTLPDHPGALADSAEIVAGLCAGLGLDRPALVGHSMGGAVAMTAAAAGLDARRIVGLNPALPVDYGRAGFLARSMVKSAREATGLGGGLAGVRFSARFHGPFLRDTLADLRGAARFMRAARDLDLRTLRVQQPTLVLFAERDEYFKLDPNAERALFEAVADLRLKRLARLNHDWPVFHPDRAADEILPFLALPDAPT